jgi:hypothetical protein
VLAVSVVCVSLDVLLEVSLELLLPQPANRPSIIARDRMDANAFFMFNPPKILLF